MMKVRAHLFTGELVEYEVDVTLAMGRRAIFLDDTHAGTVYRSRRVGKWTASRFSVSNRVYGDTRWEAVFRFVCSIAAQPEHLRPDCFRGQRQPIPEGAR